MKILQITPHFYPSVAGVETYVRDLSFGLSRRGHDIKVITINTMDAQKEEVIDSKIQVYRCSPNFHYGNVFISFEIFWKLIKSRDFDIYHIQIPFPLGIEAAAIASCLNNIPLIVNYQSEGSTRKASLFYNIMKKIFGFYEWFCRDISLRKARKVIFLTKTYADNTNLKKKIRNKVIIVKPGTDTLRFSPNNSGSMLRLKYGIKPNDKVVLFLGSLAEGHRYKGVDYLVKALKRVKDRNNNVKLVIAGGGELVLELETIAADLGLKESVFFAGFVDEELKPQYYAMCDIFVLPSTSSVEAFGLVLLEAMATGRPCITTDLPGVRENILPGITGLIVPPKDEQALADAILKLVENDELRIQMGFNARKAVEKDSLDKFAEGIEAVYREAISDGE
jgi:glycosyltransferase involved in cell wall biosynthesis